MFLASDSQGRRMPFGVTWNNLLDRLDELPADASFVTPLSGDSFQIRDVQQHRILIRFSGSEDTQPLQRDQFETLYQRITEATGGFELDRLPPDAEPYASLLSLHPRFEVDDREGILTELDTPATATSPLLDADSDTEPAPRDEPDLDVYADARLLIDALERTTPTEPPKMETQALVDLYTLLSDVQRNADDLRHDIRSILLDRLHHDRPVHGQYGSVQRTTRRNRTLKDDDEVLAALEDAGIDRERVLGVDRSKVDDALDVTELREDAVYEIDQTEYVRKADVDEDVKETRLQGLKDRLASADAETSELQAEIDELEARIEELTSFDSAQSFQDRSSEE